MGAAKRTKHRVEYLSSWAKTSYYRHKEIAFQLLGRKCVLCGFDDVRALTFDHINGGGSAERKKTDGGSIMRRICKDPKDFRVLCWNCNWIAYIDRKIDVSKNSNCQRRDDVDTTPQIRSGVSF